MKKLPRITKRAPSALQRERLARWLAEWRIDCALREADPPSAGVETAPGSHVAGSPPPAAGQVRLLAPDIPGAEDRLVYLALIRQKEPAGFLCAPYSRFSEPALPGEVRTGRAAAGLRVLCLWNAQWLPGETAGRSWFIDDLAEEERQCAEAVLQAVAAGRDLPPDVQGEVGPPLVHPFDPRRDYQAEEAALMERIVSEIGGDPSARGIVRLPWLCRDAGDGSPALAAEAKVPYGRTARFRIVGRRLYLVVTTLPAGEGYAVRIVDARDRPSGVLDGSVVRSAAGRTSSPVVGGRVDVPPEFVDDGFLLFDPTGNALPLDPSNELELGSGL